MVGKPSLKTGTLLTAPQAQPMVLAKGISAGVSQAFEGLPDPQSPAQRTLHQALHNRLVGQADVYHYLREYAVRCVWGHHAADAPEAAMALAFFHEPDLKLAVMFKHTYWSAEVEDRMLAAGWHILILE